MKVKGVNLLYYFFAFGIKYGYAYRRGPRGLEGSTRLTYSFALLRRTFTPDFRDLLEVKINKISMFVKSFSNLVPVTALAIGNPRQMI